MRDWWPQGSLDQWHPRPSLLRMVSGECPARGFSLLFCLCTWDSESQWFKSSPPTASSGAAWFITMQRSGWFFPHLLWWRYRSLHCSCGVGTSYPCCHTVLASKCFAKFCNRIQNSNQEPSGSLCTPWSHGGCVCCGERPAGRAGAAHIPQVSGGIESSG